MREIIFRGKTVCDGDWIYGGITWNPSKKKVFIHTEWDEGEVVPETVGQYTGVTDGKGTGIFEGDIVKIHLSGKPAIGVVEFGITGIAAYIVKNIDKVSSNYVLEFDKPNLYEVIGNVFDNPELMEGKK